MAPVVAQIASEHRNTFAVAKYDMDDNREIIRKFQVRGRPAYVVFKDGKVVGKRLAGVKSKAQLVQNILDAINN